MARRRSSARSARGADRCSASAPSSAPASSCCTARGDRRTGRPVGHDGVLVAGLGCAFAGLCYAEFASMIPIAGSAYTYSYATMGELVAWIIGWDLMLEYAVGAATVAIALERVHATGAASCRHADPVPVVALAVRDVADRRTASSTCRPSIILLLIMSLLLIAASSESALRQQRHRRHQGRDRAAGDLPRLGLHQPGQSHAVHSEPTTYTTPQGVTHAYGGIMGILGAAGVVFFAYHRLRRGLDGGAGSQEPAARHADRHPRLAGRSARCSMCCSPTC